MNFSEHGDLVELAHSLLPDFLRVGREQFVTDDVDWEDRSCAFFVAGFVDRPMGLATLLGGPGGNYFKREKYERNAIEKYSRLNRNIEKGHLTSYESRSPEKGQWGGAIVACVDGTESIFSLSGLPEEGDEAFHIILLQLYRRTDHRLVERCLQIVERTKNPYYERLRNELLA